MIVLTVRGTLSIKDALTDLSVSMEEMDIDDQNPNVRGSQFVHKVNKILKPLTVAPILGHFWDQELVS